MISVLVKVPPAMSEEMSELMLVDEWRQKTPPPVRTDEMEKMLPVRNGEKCV